MKIVRENINFERGGNTLERIGIGRFAPGIGQFVPAYLEGRGYCEVLKVKRYKNFTLEEKKSLSKYYGSSLTRDEYKNKIDPDFIWVKIETLKGETEWMDIDQFEELKKRGRRIDPEYEKRNGKWVLKSTRRRTNIKHEP